MNFETHDVYVLDIVKSWLLQRYILWEWNDKNQWYLNLIKFLDK